MIRNIRDITITALVLYAFCISLWAGLNPEAVGHWQAQKDVAYDTIWGEWVSDCDCTEPLE